MEKFRIDVAKDFSPVLGGRWISLGPSSGELFYDSVLKQKYLDATQANEKLHIYLDGAKGYGSSFLDQSFGELARQYGIDPVEKSIVFHASTFEWVIDYIKKEIWVRK